MEGTIESTNSLTVDAVTRLKALLSSLSPAEKQIGNYILENHQQVLQMTLAEVASCSGVSDATAVRFFRSIGYERWLDLKIALSQSDLAAPSFHEKITEDDTVEQITFKVFQNAIDALQQTASVLDQQAMSHALDLVRGASKIMVIGAGTSCPVAQELFNRLFRLGLNVSIETDSLLQVMQASLLKPEDLLIAISQTGESSSAIRTTLVAVGNGTPVIAITGNRLSDLARMADAVLLSASHELIQETLASRIAQHAITHALYINLAQLCPEESMKYENTIWKALIETMKIR